MNADEVYVLKQIATNTKDLNRSITRISDALEDEEQIKRRFRIFCELYRDIVVNREDT